MNFISTRRDFKHNIKPESIILIAMTLALSVACGSDVVDQSHTSNLDDNSSASEKIQTEKIQPSEQTASPTSNKAPDFSLPSIHGRTFTRSDFEGDKTVLLVFYRAFW
jgi:cytochrome oxidase Cu insertion factor (SCO1/SenC/PrrC family)